MTKKITRIYVAVTALIALGCLNADAFNSSHYKSSSALSSGHWVKIKVTESGMQQITFDQLAQWGFTDPSLVTVYGYGGVAAATENFLSDFPDDLVQQPVVLAGDKIVFYGESNVRSNLHYTTYNPTLAKAYRERNYAADAGYYFITDSQTLVDVPAIAYEEAASPRVWAYHKSPGFYEEEVMNYGNAGQLFVGRDIADGTVIDLSFPTPKRYTGALFNENTQGAYIMTTTIVAGIGAKPIFTVTYPKNEAGGTTATRSLTLGYSPSLPTIEYSHSEDTSASYYRYDVSKIASEDMQTAPFAINRSSANNCDMSSGALDFFAYYYPRTNDMEGESAVLMLYDNISKGDRIVFENANDNICVWDVSNAYNVRPYTVTTDTDDSSRSVTVEKNYTLNDSNNYLRIMAFDPSGEHNAVEFVADINNQNIHSQAVPDMVIITSELLFDYAEQLAQLHRDHQGLDVLVIKQDDIFNEFSSGTPSTSAIRRMAKMFYDRNSSKFRNLLLFGGGSHDNRGITPTAGSFKNEGSLLLTYSTTEHAYQTDDTRSFASDCYFGMLRDNFNIALIHQEPMAINVGRIPARNVAHAIDVINKTRNYLTYFPSVDIFHRMVIASDNGDSNSHMLNAESTAEILAENIGGATVVKGYVSLYPVIRGESPTLREALNQSFSMGTGFFAYTGHGAPSSFAGEKIMSINLVKQNEYDFFPFAVLATCDAYNYDRLSDNIAETMIFTPKGGMIGVIGACRTVYADRNQALLEVAAKMYGNAGANALTGDIMRLTRNQIVSYNSMNGSSEQKKLLENTMTYNYCGDPALPLYYAQENIRLQSIDGNPVSGSDKIELIPGSTVNVKGYVANSSGNTDSSFNGTVILSLYEAPRVMNSYSHSGSGDKSVPVTLDEDLLCQAVVNVIDGEFSADVTIPYPMRSGEYNRLTAYAYTSDLKNFSSSWTNNLWVNIDGELDTPNEDVTGPEISGLWLDSTDFVSGDAVANNFTVLAKIEPDPSGLKVSTGNVGTSTRVIIDGTRTTALLGSALAYQQDGSIEVSWPMNVLTAGNHTLTMICVDNLGNVSNRTIAFTVAENAADAQLSVPETTGHTEFNFALEHTFGATPVGRIVIENLSGEKVHVIDNVTFDGEVTWDLTLGDSKLVADGVYRAYAVVSDGKATAATTPIELVIVQKM